MALDVIDKHTTFAPMYDAAVPVLHEHEEAACRRKQS